MHLRGDAGKRPPRKENVTTEHIYNKLVRDRIPAVITQNGGIPVIRTLDEAAYRHELEAKLHEEYCEVLAATGEERLEEMADMLEVIRALAQTENHTLSQLIALADKKAAQRGAFEERIFLEKVIAAE